MEPIIITCAVTGGDNAVLEKHPDIPKSPSEIAEACLAAGEAGAAVVHIHVRDPETGLATNKTELYAKVVEEIKASNKELLINLTGGCDGDVVFTETDPPQLSPETDLRSAESRIRHIVELKPDLASLDVGVAGTEESFYVIKPSEAKYMAEAMRDAGVKPELECFEFGHIEVALQLIKAGVINDPPMFQMCLGTGSGAPGDPAVLQPMISRLPHNAVWGAFGCGRTEMPIVAAAAIMGGNVRVGLEDNIYLRKGVLADNQGLVRNAAEIIDRIGYKVATIDEARKKLNLPARKS